MKKSLFLSIIVLMTLDSCQRGSGKSDYYPFQSVESVLRRALLVCVMILVCVVAHAGEVPGGRFTDLPGHDGSGSDGVVIVLGVLVLLVVGGFFLYMYVQEHWETVKEVLSAVAFIGAMVFMGMCASATSKEHAREQRAQERKEMEERVRERRAAEQKAQQKRERENQLERWRTPSGSVSGRTTRRRTVTYYEQCDVCGGRGKVTCKLCGGTGMREKICTYCNGSGGHRRVKCFMCKGKGKIKDSYFDEVNCGNCWGSGWVEEYCHWCSGSGKSSSLCDNCNGMLSGGQVTCTACGGSGQVSRTREETY